MAYNFKEYMERPDRLTAVTECAGCGKYIALRNVMKAVPPEPCSYLQCNKLYGSFHFIYRSMAGFLHSHSI